MSSNKRSCKCGKPLHRMKSGKLYCYCRDCKNSKHKIYWAEHKEQHKRYVRKSYLKYNYGMSVEDFDWLFNAQGKRCSICQRELMLQSHGNPLQACIDHNHQTEQVRGILCSECNGALGLFHENKEALLRAIEYLS